ncbi:MAG TPA: GEVED domain-containing protein [Chitinophagaceae bacterium]|nr:GEVED domain-containing protein [Chitinophagaceae bacterium]
MKTTIHLLAYKPTLKFVRSWFINLFVVAYFLVPTSSFSQCTNYTVNWDYLDFLHNSAGSWYNFINPATGQPFVTNTMKQSQNYSLGPTNVLNIATSMAVGGSGVFYGDVTDHAGDVAGYTGADIKFIPTAGQTITLTFLNEVSNASFTLYDVDASQAISVAATNTGGTPQTVGVATYGTTILGVAGSPGKTITATSAAIVSPSNTGTATFNITGAVKTITITVSTSGADATFWFSDIIACFTDPGFPTDYYKPYTQPYTGQPAYFLANPDMNLNVYMVDPVNRTADLLFTDPGIGGNSLNSIAYDPVNKYVYYVLNGSGAGAANRSLKRYDVNTNSISTVIADLNTFGVPTFTQGVEAASAAFYNGCLYLGVEGTEPSTFSTNTESIIWRIDFSGSTPIRASQVFGMPNDNGGGQPSHDWGDFITKDGTIITHASTRITPTYQSQWIHFNMTTSTATNTYNLYADTSGQLGQIYDGTVYRVDNRIALYNNDGTTAVSNPISVTSCSPSWNNRPANDASDPFRPALDFGDAPASYDPVALSPAANQKACNNSLLRLGSAWDREWALNSSVNASGDGMDEDGVSTVSIMVSDGHPYNHVQEVTVLNNTGAIAYLAGWLDYNANGVFDASEGVVVTVPSSASPQTITLGWTGITIATGTPNSFLRVRLYSGALTTSSATGWLADGETEDYPVISQSMPLVIDLLDFNATLTREKDVILNWRAYVDDEAKGFEVERSKDQNNWEKIGTVNLKTSNFTSDYSLLDQQPLQGRSYYRLKMVEKTGSSRYSKTRLIQIDQLVTKLRVYPNPAKNDFTISFKSTMNQSATLIVRSIAGEVMIRKSITLTETDNQVSVSVNGLSNGLYVVELFTPEKTFVNKLTVTH